MGNDGAPQKEKILAERFKTQMCRNWERKGVCPYDNKCMFAHGEKDLRTPEANVRDGLFTEESIEAFRRAQRLLKKRASQREAVEKQATTIAEKSCAMPADTNPAEASPFDVPVCSALGGAMPVQSPPVLDISPATSLHRVPTMVGMTRSQRSITATSSSSAASSVGAEDGFGAEDSGTACVGAPLSCDTYFLAATNVHKTLETATTRPLPTAVARFYRHNPYVWAGRTMVRVWQN